MFKVDAPARMSTPGHSTSGADAVGDAGWLTPGFAPEKKLEIRVPHDGVVSYGSITLEADEQPETRAETRTALAISAAARRPLRSLLLSPIEISQFSDAELSPCTLI